MSKSIFEKSAMRQVVKYHSRSPSSIMTTSSGQLERGRHCVRRIGLALKMACISTSAMRRSPLCQGTVRRVAAMNALYLAGYYRIRSLQALSTSITFGPNLVMTRIVSPTTHYPYHFIPTASVILVALAQYSEDPRQPYCSMVHRRKGGHL